MKNFFINLSKLSNSTREIFVYKKGRKKIVKNFIFKSLKFSVSLFVIIGLSYSPSSPVNKNVKEAQAAVTVVENFTSSGTWIAPPGVTSIQIEARGSGGGGGAVNADTNKAAGAGAGGQYVIETAYAVTPGTSYAFSIGNGGTAGSTTGPTNGGTGGDVTFNSTGVVAKGGAGGQTYENGFQGGAGSTTGGVGDTVYAGGNGGNGGAFNGSGGGGEGGRSNGNGGNGGNGSSGVAGAAGTGGDGGDGNIGKLNAAGAAGTVPGGGGSGGSVGANTTNRAGGAGGKGNLRITYTDPDVSGSPVFIDAGAQITGTSTSLTPVLPTNISGDLLLAVMISQQAAGNTYTFPGGEGWAQRAVALYDSTNDVEIELWWKISDGTESNPAITMNTCVTTGCSAQVFSYRGVDPTTPFDLASSSVGSNAAAATHTPTAITTLTNSARAFSIVATGDDNALNQTANQGFSVRAAGANYDTTTGTDHAIGLADKAVASAGSTTMPTWNQSLVGNDAWARISDALKPAPANPTVSGTCKQADNSTNCADSESVKIYKNTTLIGTTTTSSGAFSVASSESISNGDIITVFIDGVADSLEANAVTKYDGTGDITGIQLIEGELTIGSADNQSISNANIGTYDYSASTNDEDIFYDVTGSDIVLSGINASNDNSISVLSGNTYAPAGTISLDGSFTNAGTFTHGSSTITFTSTNSGKTITAGGTTFYNLTFNGSGGEWLLQDAVTIGNVLTLTNGTFNIGTYTVTLSGTTGTPFVITSGTFNYNAGTVSYTGVNAGGNTTIKNTTYYNLTINAAETFDFGGSTVVENNFTITTGTVNGGTYSLTIGGNFANSGTFTADTSTVIFNDNTKTSTISGTITFNNLTVTTQGKDLEFTAGQIFAVDGVLTLNGGSGEGFEITLNSTTGSSEWTLDNTVLNSADVSDTTVTWAGCVSGSPEISGATDGGNNEECWTFGTYISGTAYLNDETTADTAADSYAFLASVNGLTADVGEGLTDGSWSILLASAPSAGDIVTIWIYDEIGPIAHATTVLEYGASCTPDCSGIKLVHDQIRIESKHTGNTIAISELDACDDETGMCQIAIGGGVGFTVNTAFSGFTGTWATHELVVVAGTTLTGNYTYDIEKLQLDGNLNAPQSHILLSGVGTNGTCTASTSMPLCGSGTINHAYIDVNNYGSVQYITSASTWVQSRNDYGFLWLKPQADDLTFTLSSGTLSAGIFLMDDTGPDPEVTGIITDASVNNPNVNILETAYEGLFGIGGLLLAGTEGSGNELKAGSGTWTIDTELPESGIFINTIFTPNTSTFVFTGSSGSVVASVDGGTTNYYNLQIKPAANSGTATFDSGTFNIGGSLIIGNGINTGVVVSSGYAGVDVAGDVTISANTTFNLPSYINVAGNWTTTGAFTQTPGTGYYTIFDATTTGKTITTNGSAFAGLQFDGVGGGWTLGSDITVADALSINNGTLNASSRTITLTDDNTPFEISGGTFTPGTSTVRYTGTAATYIPATNYYHLEIKPSGNSVTHTLLNGTFNIGGNLTLGNGTNTGVAVTGVGYNPVLNVGGLLSIANNTTYTTGTGTLTMTSTLATAGPLFSRGSDVNNSNFVASTGHTTALTASSGTVDIFANYNAFVDSNSFYNFVVNGAAVFDFGDQSFDVANELTVSAGTLTNSDSGGDIEVGSTSISGSGKVHVASGATLYIRTLWQETAANESLCIGSTGATCADSAAGNITLYGTWYINPNGTVGRTASIGGTGTTISLGVLRNDGIGKTTFNAGTSTVINFIGANANPIINMEYATAFNAGTSTIKYLGTTNFNIDGLTYNNLEVSPGQNSVTGTFVANADSWGAAGTFVTGNLVIGDGTGSARVVTANTNSTTLDVDGNFTISNNTTFVAHASNPFTIGGNFSRGATASVFTHSSGTVTFNDNTKTSTISGSNTFHNLSVTTAGKDLTFTAGETTRINGLLTLTGGSDGGNEITLNSTTGSSSWTINHQGTENITYTTVTWSACDGTSTQITANGTGNTDGGNNGGCWTLPASGITVSGLLYQADGTTVDPTVRALLLSVNGAANQTVNSTVTTGAFSFTTQSAPVAGDMITVWVDGGAVFGTLAMKYGTSCTGTPNCTGLSLIENRVTLLNNHTGVLANSDLAGCDADTGTGCNTANLKFTSNSSNLVVSDGSGLNIASNYTPGGTVTTSPSADGADSNMDGDLIIASTKTLDMGTNALSVGGDFVNAGTFSESASPHTTTFTATATGHTIDLGTGNFENVNFNGASGGWSFGDANNTVDGDITLTAGTLSGTTNLTVSGGDVTGNGTITLTGGTFTVNTAGNFGGDTGWTFSSLTIGGAGNATTTATGSGSITVSSVLTIDTGDTLDAGSKTWTLSGSGTPLVRNGTFTDNTSTFNYTSTTGITAVSSAVMTGSNSFYNLTFNMNGQSYYSGVDMDIANDLTITAGFFNYSGNTTVNGHINVNSSLGYSNSPTFTHSTTTSKNFGGNGTMLFLSLEIGGSGGETTATGSGNTFVLSTLTIGADDTLDAGSRTWILSGSGTPFVNSGTFKHSTSTVNYNGTSATNIAALNGAGATNAYYNLGFGVNDGSNSVTYTSTGDTTVNNVITVSSVGATGTDTLALSSHTWTLKGSGTPLNIISGKGALSAGTSTVVYASSSGVVDLASATLFLNNITINGTGTFASGHGVNLTGDLTVTSGTLYSNSDSTVYGGDITGNGIVNLYADASLFLYNNGSFGGDSDWNIDNLIIGEDSGDTTTAIGTGSITSKTLLMNGSLNAGAKTWNITGTGTPFSVEEGALLTPETSTFNYTGGNTTNITPATYNNLGILPSANSATHTMTAGEFTIGGNLVLGNGANTGVTVNGTAATTLDINGTGTSFDLKANTTFSAPSAMSVAGSWSVAGTFTRNSSTVTFDATSTGKTIASGGQSFNNIIFNGSGGGWSPSSALVAIGDITVTNGTLSGTNSVEVYGGDVTGNGTINMTGSTFIIDGTGNFGGNTAWTFNNLTFGDGTGTTTTSSTGSGGITVSSILTIAANQTLDAGAKTWTLSGAGTPLAPVGILGQGTSTFRYTSPTGVTAMMSENTGDNFYNLIIDSTGDTFTAGSGITLNIKNDLTVSGGTLAMGDSDLYVGNYQVAESGNIKVSSGQSLTQTAVGNTFVFTGDASPNCIGGGSSNCAGTAGTITFGDLNIGAGLFDAPITTIGGSNNTVTILGQLIFSGAATFNAGSGTILNINGNGDVFSGTPNQFNAGTSTVNFNSTDTTGTTVPALTYYNLGINRASNTFTAGGNIVVGNDFTITAGTFVAPESLTINGDLSNSGTFTPNAGTVTLTPTGNNKTVNVAGSSNTTFYNLTNTTPDSILTFKAGNTYTFTNLLTLTGASGRLINLSSETGGQQWIMTLSGSSSVSYVKVKDSGCSGGNNVPASRTVRNYGNNGACWQFISSVIFQGGFDSEESATPNSVVTGGGGGGSSGPAGGGGQEDPTPASGTAVLTNNIVTGVVMTAAGAGYIIPPIVSFCGGGGSGALGTAVLEGSGVDRVNITNGGTSYETAPEVRFGTACPQGGGGGGGDEGGDSGFNYSSSNLAYAGGTGFSFWKMLKGFFTLSWW